MSDDEQRLTQAPASVQRAGEYWVLVPRAPAEVAVVNATGYHIFQQCDGSRSQADIAQTIADAAGADVERVTGDVAAFLAHLTAAGLLVVSNTAPTQDELGR